MGMELGDVVWTMTDTGVTRACISLSFGAWLAGMLYLVVQSPWVGVLACGCALGYALCEWWTATCDLQERQEEVAELEKQVVVLKSAMQEMAVLDSVCEARTRKARFLASRERWPSNHSL